MSALDAIRAADFDWAVRINDVWSRPASDVPHLHAKLRAEFADKLGAMERNPGAGSPLGWVVVGDGGSGKTHLLGAFRREASRRKCPFIMVDLTDVRNFWESVLQGYMDSLQQQFDGDIPQHKWVIGNIVEKYGPGKSFTEILASLLGRKSRDPRADGDAMLNALAKSYPKETIKYHNVVRALVCLNSDDFMTSSLGQTWLQGRRLDDDDAKRLGFTVQQEPPIRIVEALSWFTSLSGPSILAFDQLDPIVTQLHYRKQGEPSAAEQATAESIIVEIGGGLGTLRDLTRNTLTLVSCIETTWDILGSTVLKTFLDRFEEPWRLSNVADAEVARALVGGRLDAAFRTTDFAPPYPTFPFRPEAFDALKIDSPREILKKCDAHRRRCLEGRQVVELPSFAIDAPKPEPAVAPAATAGAHRLDAEFAALRAEADPTWILEEKFDDERLAPLLQSALACLLHESDLGSDVDATVDVQFTGGAKTVPLHARLRLIFTKENEREEHYCVRALQQTNARAYQVRLKSALTQSGIDRTLPFRRLALIRSTAVPGGAETKKLTDEFTRLGGVFLAPTVDELRTLHALHTLRARRAPDFEAWLKARRHASSLAVVRKIVTSERIGSGADVPAPPDDPGSTETEPDLPVINPVAPEPATVEMATMPFVSTASRLPLGRRLLGGKPGESIGMPVHLLEKHALVLAGAGSGKTVFLKRLVEESALLGVPSIVVDVANDMAALDERWDESPASWTEDDREKADQYHRAAEVVVWTPGKESGNPLAFEPLPDLAPLADDEDELDTAASMVVETLAPVVAAGQSFTATQKRAVLKASLKYLAAHGGGRLDALIDLLDDLPPEAGPRVANEAKMAAQMADALKAERVMNPLLRSRGTTFDPAVLFGSERASDPARISVVSLVGLPNREAQRHFLNQLAMTLFSWVKKNPHPGDRPLRGLLVIDEARDFVPSQQATVCRDSLLRLVAQARKYHLGVVFATQNPKDVDHKIMANCSTHVYGKVNSPAAIETVRDLIQSKGGSAADVATLPSGCFYVHNADADVARPTKIVAPFCLSRHPRNPLDEAAVVAKAAASRARLQARPRPHSRDVKPRVGEPV
jgi:Helicase HerA, central domain